MRVKYIVSVLAVLFLAGTCYCTAASEDTREVKNGAATSTLDDQTGVALTIYNVNLGLVKDQRQIRLSKGISDLRFMDVAAQIMPTSVQIKSLASPETLQVLEQNYE